MFRCEQSSPATGEQNANNQGEGLHSQPKRSRAVACPDFVGRDSMLRGVGRTVEEAADEQSGQHNHDVLITLRSPLRLPPAGGRCDRRSARDLMQKELARVFRLQQSPDSTSAYGNSYGVYSINSPAQAPLIVLQWTRFHPSRILPHRPPLGRDRHEAPFVTRPWCGSRIGSPPCVFLACSSPALRSSFLIRAFTGGRKATSIRVR